MLYKELLITKIVFQPVKITSADSVPKSFSSRSADSAGQCYKKLYKEENLNEKLCKEL